VDLTDIEKQFSDVGLARGCVFLLPETEALRFISACEERAIPLLGVSCFRVFGEQIQPDQGHDLDLLGDHTDSHSIARRFVEERIGLGLWFETGNE
jgi:hypothetical protein